MTAVKIREKVHSIIDNADERILKVVYAMLKEYEKVEAEPSLLTEEQKDEVDRRWENHKSGKSKSYTIDEVNKHVKARLKK
ncbi:MAG: addiction module protein [Bacteroidetes bacterium]|nr:addiction module protein [Bacteroidota bacterium]